MDKYKLAFDDQIDKYKHVFEFQELVRYDHKVTLIHVSQHNINELLQKYASEGATEVYIHGEEVDEVIIPEGVKIFSCCNMGIKRLIVSDSVEYLYADRNRLKYIDLPENIQIVSLRHNFLTHITFRSDPKKLLSLDLYDNYLRELMFDPPKSLGCLKITGNEHLQSCNMHPTINKRILEDDEFLDDSPF